MAAKKDVYATAVPLHLVVNGERGVVPPGTELPEGALNAHDARELLASGAIVSQAAAEADAQAKADAAEAAQAAFQEQRALVQEAAASTASVETDDNGQPVTAPAGGKKAGKK